MVLSSGVYHLEAIKEECNVTPDGGYGVQSLDIPILLAGIPLCINQLHGFISFGLTLRIEYRLFCMLSTRLTTTRKIFPRDA
jgi:hypothetical protein